MNIVTRRILSGKSEIKSKKISGLELFRNLPPLNQSFITAQVKVLSYQWPAGWC